jgi:hypothetical protein
MNDIVINMRLFRTPSQPLMVHQTLCSSTSLRSDPYFVKFLPLDLRRSRAATIINLVCNFPSLKPSSLNVCALLWGPVARVMMKVVELSSVHKGILPTHNTISTRYSSFQHYVVQYLLLWCNALYIISSSFCLPTTESSPV